MRRTTSLPKMVVSILQAALAAAVILVVISGHEASATPQATSENDVAVEESRLPIPILFAYDTIHGYRTVFPVPLGAASSFDPNVAQTDAAIGARESATVGIKQVYGPMVDVSHDPRWGRIVEGAGEDPYLNSVFAAARVKGAQGSEYAASDKVVTSPKHYVAYGQPEGGRDYDTTDMSEQRLRNFYLPPFKAAIDAGADTVMCSFNAINGVPGSLVPRCRGGNAAADVLFGKVNPGGKLPVSFPQALGQVPIYYNHEPTGRPCDTTFKWNSRYRDLTSCDPLYEFGYGLSYTTFSISNPRLNSRTMRANGAGITATVDVKNTGSRRGDEVVQLYIHDPVASISQPVRRLRDFQRVTLDPGQTKSVKFTLDSSDVGFYDNSGRFVVEPGTIDVYVGNSSSGGLAGSFTVVR